MFQLGKQGAVKIITGEAPLNAESITAAEKVCAEALAQGQPRLVFNLQHVPLLDSAGLELLLSVRDRCLQRGGSLHLAAPPPLCRDILAATRLLGQFAVFDDVLSAAGSFSQ